MLLNLVEYHWAEHVDDALLLLARFDVKTVPLAGGTHLLSLNDDSIQAVVDLRDLDLAYISEDARGIHIGAMTSLQQMADSPLLKETAMGVLANAARASSSSRLIRNSATIGGTIGAGVASQADVLTALQALDAEALVRSGSKTQVGFVGLDGDDRLGSNLSGITYKGKQERRLSISDFYASRRPSELIIELVIPQVRHGSGASFMRVGRTPAGSALLNAVALIEVEEEKYRRARLVLGGANMESVRVEGVEQGLEGHAFDKQVILAAVQEGMGEFRPPTDVYASAGYRRAIGGMLAYHALEEATEIARWHNVISLAEKR
jgi:CO/xanthine dehydrogenase FAD-binding subunit